MEIEVKVKEFFSRILKRKASKEKHAVENRDAVIWTMANNLRSQGQNSGLGAVMYFNQKNKERKD